MAPVAGLFGKLPAHGDFVRRGWPDETVDAIDRWLTGGMAAAREGRDDDDFALWMHAAPLWQGYVPPGMLGPLALHAGVVPSVDRAGRLFPIAAGVAGEARAAWSHARRSGASLDAAIYDALAGRIDADGLIDQMTSTAGAFSADEMPLHSVWWLGMPADGAPVVEAGTIDIALFQRLMDKGPA